LQAVGKNSYLLNLWWCADQMLLLVATVVAAGQ